MFGEIIKFIVQKNQVMETAELRARILKYIEQADVRVLKRFYSIIEAENSAANEQAREAGIGSLKDDHRLK